MDQSKLLAELERRFPWLVEATAEAMAEEIIDALADWYTGAKEQAVAQALSEALEKREAYEQALRAVESLTGEIDDLGECLDYPAADVIAMGKGDDSESGAVSLPLLTFQACAAIGLASALWGLYLRLVAQLGGLGL
jgi:hypothetical protein